MLTRLMYQVRVNKAGYIIWGFEVVGKVNMEAIEELYLVLVGLEFRSLFTSQKTPTVSGCLAT